MPTIDDPRTTLRAMLQGTGRSTADLATASGVNPNRLRAALDRLQHLPPGEIARCHAVLSVWLTTATTTEARDGAR